MKNIAITTLTIIGLNLLFACCNSNIKTQVPEQKFALLDSLFKTAVDQMEIPGAVVYIAKKGQPVYHKAFGFRDIESSTNMEVTDIFRMASMTKALTAVATLQLVERGLIRLDDNIADYISEFSQLHLLKEVHSDSTYTSEPIVEHITIRQLLTHTSGIGYGFQDERYNALILKNNISEGFEDDNRTSLANIQRIAKLPLLHKPGEKYTYSLSYDVLGVLIEQVSKLRYDHYIQHFILNPIGMNDSYFIVPKSEQYRIPKAYQPNENGTQLIPTAYPDTLYPKLERRQYFSGGADLCSTAKDYGDFIQMIKEGGYFNNKRILGKRYIEMMLSKQTKLDDGGYDQGFAAWMTNEQGAAEGPMGLGSYGFGGFWDTYSWVDPKQDYIAVLLLQMYPSNAHKTHEKFQAITYGIIDEL